MTEKGSKSASWIRNDDNYQELSKGSQSGGEKSVTTAVYMMALQGLTQVQARIQVGGRAPVPPPGALREGTGGGGLIWLKISKIA